MLFSMPGSADALFTFKDRYENFVGGEWVAPAEGNYFDNITPITGEAYCEIPKSSPADLRIALKAAHAAADSWGKTPAAARSNILLKIADRIEENLQTLAYVETWDNGKGIRETLNADVPLLVDHFRYFAAAYVPRKALLPKLIRIRFPITSTSRLVLLDKSFRGISRCSWRDGSWHRRLPPATALF